MQRFSNCNTHQNIWRVKIRISMILSLECGCCCSWDHLLRTTGGVEKMEAECQCTWVLIPAPSLMGYASFSKLHALSGLQGLCDKLRCKPTLWSCCQDYVNSCGNRAGTNCEWLPIPLPTELPEWKAHLWFLSVSYELPSLGLTESGW